MSKQHVLIIGGKDHTYQRVDNLGLRFSAIQISKLVTDYQIQNASHLIVTDYRDIERCVALAVALHQHDPLDAVVSFSEYSQAAAANIAEALAIPTNCHRKSIEATRDKYQLRQILNQQNIGCVPSKIIHSESELRDFQQQIGKPIIVKPKTGTGSSGIFYLGDIGDSSEAIKHCTKANQGEILAEMYIDGDEYSVESISSNGTHEIVMITKKYTSGAPHFIETAHQQPAQINETIKQKIEQTVLLLLKSVEHRFGPAHTEVKVFNEEVYVIESQLRFGGDQIWEMTWLVSGVDLVNETICDLVNLPKSPRNSRYKSMAILFLMNPCTPETLNQLLESYKLTSYLIRQSIENITTTEKIKDSGGRHGYLLFGFQDKASLAQWQSFQEKFAQVAR